MPSFHVLRLHLHVMDETSHISKVWESSFVLDCLTMLQSNLHDDWTKFVEEAKKKWIMEEISIMASWIWHDLKKSDECGIMFLQSCFVELLL